MTFRVDRHYWWDAGRTRLFPSGHPEAAILAYAAGSDIPDSEARRVGLLQGTGPADPVVVASPGETPAEKMRAARLSTKVGPKPASKATTADEETL